MIKTLWLLTLWLAAAMPLCLHLVKKAVYLWCRTRLR